MELKKDGSNIKVTAESRMEYIQLYVNYFLAKRVSLLKRGIGSLAFLHTNEKSIMGPCSVLSSSFPFACLIHPY